MTLRLNVKQSKINYYFSISKITVTVNVSGLFESSLLKIFISELNIAFLSGCNTQIFSPIVLYCMTTVINNTGITIGYHF